MLDEAEFVVPGGRMVKRYCLAVHWTYQGVPLYTEAPFADSEVLLNLIDSLSGGDKSGNVQSRRVEAKVEFQPDELASAKESDDG